MLTRRSGAPRTVHRELAHAALPPLPLALVLAILLLLPVDQRLLLALVSRAWRAATDDRSLWEQVSVAPESGVSRVSDSLLRALAAKARGALVLLDVSAQVHDEDGPLTTGCVLEAVAANGRTLRRLVVLDKSSVVTSIPTVEALLRAAPHLTSADADVYCPSAQALLLLRGEAPFGALRVRKLEAKPPWAGAGAVAALARAVAAHPSLAWLSLDGAPLQPGTDALAAVVDVAVGKGLARLDLVSCGLDAAAGAAQLARLLRDDPRLGMLAVFNAGQALLDAAVTPPFCAALRSCTLTTLWLTAVRLFDDPAVGVAVVDALAGHPTIEVLWLAGNPAASPEDRPGAGAALARLLTPGGVLRELHIKRNLLSDAGLRPVLAALPGCARLRALHLQGNGATRAFARDELLPAVAAAPGLRVLQADDDPSVPELAQAEALVAARPRGA